MSRSPARAASVSSQTLNPSGSSVAIEPASTSCASGTRSRTMRNASITPTGSFHGSKRLTWHTIGRFTSTPYCLVSSWQNGIASSRFFTDSGSMHGGARHDVRHVERGGHELGHGPHRRVVQLHERAEELPHLRVGVGEVDVAAPDPRGVLHLAAEALAEEAEHRRRLRVVHHDVVVVALEEQRVVEHLLEVRALHARRPLDVGALEPVVHGLGDGEELVAAVHHLPVGVDADAAQQRHVGGEQLGDAAAVRGGVDVQHARALQRLRQLADLVDDLGADHPRVVVDVLLEQGDAVEHGHSGVPGTGISVNLSSDALRSRVPRQVQGHVERGRRGRGDGGRIAARRLRRRSRRCRSPTAARARSTRCVAARGGSRRQATVTGPLGDPVDAEWALLPGGVAVVEMAQASGLALMPRVARPVARVDPRHRRAHRRRDPRRRASGDRGRRRERDDRRRARRARGARAGRSARCR